MQAEFSAAAYFCGNTLPFKIHFFYFLLFIKDALNQSKVTVKTFIMLQKISILNKCCSFELSIHL